MTTLVEFRRLVRDYANKGESALQDSVVDRSLKWAADDIYHVLDYPPFESVLTLRRTTHPQYFNDVEEEDFSRIVVPENFTKMISIMDTIEPARAIVYNSKLDYRSFRDDYSRNPFDNYIWTRQGGHFLIYPKLPENTCLELFMYRRLLDIKIERIDSAEPAVGYYTDINGATRRADTDAEYTPVGTTSAVFNWLRDSNEKALLFGALAHAFDVLEDEDMKQRWLLRFKEEIAMLSNEEHKRRTSGGNLVITYDTNDQF